MVTMITDEMRALVDRTMRRATSYPIGANDIRRWAIAIYYPEVPPRLFWDEEYAATTRWGGIVAPEEFNPFETPNMAGDMDKAKAEFDRALALDPKNKRAADALAAMAK